MNTCKRSDCAKPRRMGRHWKVSFKGSIEVVRLFARSLEPLVHSAVLVAELDPEDFDYRANCFFVTNRQFSEVAISRMNVSNCSLLAFRFTDEDSFVKEMREKETAAGFLTEVIKIREFISRAGRQALSMKNNWNNKRKVQSCSGRVGKEDVDPLLLCRVADEPDAADADVGQSLSAIEQVASCRDDSKEEIIIPDSFLDEITQTNDFQEIFSTEVEIPELISVNDNEVLFPYVCNIQIVK